MVEEHVIDLLEYLGEYVDIGPQALKRVWRRAPFRPARGTNTTRQRRFRPARSARNT